MDNLPPDVVAVISKVKADPALLRDLLRVLITDPVIKKAAMAVFLEKR